MRAAFAMVLVAAVLVPLALAGCGSESKPAPQAVKPVVAPVPGKASPGNVSYGTIVVMRAVATAGGNGGLEAPAGAAGSTVRSSILVAIGAASVPVGAEGAPATGIETEFIVREDDGRMISVVQGNEARLKRGERVMIIHGPETELAPLGKA